MYLRLCLLILLLALVSCSNIKDHVGSYCGIDIVGFGLYERRLLYREGLESSPAVSINRIYNPVQISKTDLVPRILGSKFGVEYVITSPFKSYVNMGVRWMPLPSIRRGDGTVLSEIYYEQQKKVGEVLHLGYTLNSADELVPDSWTVQLSINGSVFSEKKFFVVTY